MAVAGRRNGAHSLGGDEVTQHKGGRNALSEEPFRLGFPVSFIETLTAQALLTEGFVLV